MTHFIGGNQLKLLRNGTEYFPALEFAIQSAEHEIYLQTYICGIPSNVHLRQDIAPGKTQNRHLKSHPRQTCLQTQACYVLVSNKK